MFLVLRVWNTCSLLTTGWKSRYTFWPWSRSSGRDLRIFLKWEFAFFLCGLYFCNILASKTIDQFMNCPIRIWNHKRTLPIMAARGTSRGIQKTHLLGLLDDLRLHYVIRRIVNLLVLHLASTYYQLLLEQLDILIKLLIDWLIDCYLIERLFPDWPGFIAWLTNCFSNQ